MQKDSKPLKSVRVTRANRTKQFHIYHIHYIDNNEVGLPKHASSQKFELQLGL
jgi:hypothetical protein